MLPMLQCYYIAILFTVMLKQKPVPYFVPTWHYYYFSKGFIKIALGINMSVNEWIMTSIRLHCDYFVVTFCLCMNIKQNLSYYASIMLDAFIDLLCSTLCWHNRPGPTHMYVQSLYIGINNLPLYENNKNLFYWVISNPA